MVPVCADEGPSLNVCNQNAAALLAVLGLTETIADDTGAQSRTTPAFDAGGEDAATFLGRILLAQALAPTDPGRPVTQSSDGRFVDGGRRPGYTQEKLGELERIARWALEHDREVTWA
ncbi:hypothetical protein GS504_01390 [Rhodococcus hoagii]|nr:hypothetical protein [Prescottella equi]NKS71673.1 hypothetical protein [Prescottella equi]